jgi:hypothetical protein
MPAPENWKAAETPLGLQLHFECPWGKVRIAGLVLGLAIAGWCGKVCVTLLLAGLRGELMIGGFVLLPVIAGGFLFGVYIITGMFRSTTYLLGPGTLEITSHWPLRKEKTETIDRGFISQVNRLYTNPKGSWDPGTWRTVLSLDGGEPRRKEIALEGSTKEESKWLTGIFTGWAKVATHTENTDGAGEEEEATAGE